MGKHLQQSTYQVDLSGEGSEILFSRLYSIGCFVRIDNDASITLCCTDAQRRKARKLIDDWVSGDFTEDNDEDLIDDVDENEDVVE